MNIQLIAIVALSILSAAFLNLWLETRDDFTTYRSMVEQAQAQAEADAAERLAEYTRINRETGDAWAAALAADRAARPVVRVRLPADCSVGQMPTVPAATGLSASATSESGLRRDVVIAVAECEARLNNAAQDAAQVLMLQQWLRATHEASR